MTNPVYHIRRHTAAICHRAAFCLLLVLCCHAQRLPAQDSGQIRLIIRGDDMGFCHAANEACVDAYTNGIMTSVEVMPVTPWFAEAAALLRKHPGLDAGVHLTLTSEWENLKWRPLTHSPSLTDTNGYFFPMIWPNEHYDSSQALQSQHWQLREIEQEFRAQIEMAQKAIPQLSHLTAHMGCTGMDEQVEALFRKLAAAYGLAIHPESLGVQRVSYQGPHATYEEKLKSFTAMLQSLTPGTYLFVDHPAYDTPEVRAVYHTGYEDVAADRQGVTDLLTSPEIQQLIRQKKIQLISYAGLAEKK